MQFAFRVHQSQLYTLNEDGTASYVFTPGWFKRFEHRRDDGALGAPTRA